MRILTDFPRFPEHSQLADGRLVEASTLLATPSRKNPFKVLRHIRQADLLLIQESEHILTLALLFELLPFLKRPIIAVDLILRTPHTLKQKIVARFKRMLFDRVDHFIHYFQRLDGYTTYYGISPDRSSYVPFKSNMHGNPQVAGLKLDGKEEYVYTAGRSLRDFDTLFAALSQLDVPAAIPQPDFDRLRQHGARFTWAINNLPKNVELLDDTGSPESWITNLDRAKVVVIPTLRDNLCASGIGTYLDAMALKKCVIISEGPGVSDVLRDEAIIVPPEDPTALASAIRKVWEDPTLRSETAQRGFLYASKLGGEPELMQRLLLCAVDWYQTRS